MLSQLFRKWSGKEPDSIHPILGSGSSRAYYRLKNGERSAIGVYNPLDEENRAFLYFTRHFLSHRLPVPEIYAENPEEHAYLLSDLGDRSLFSMVEESRTGEGYNSAELEAIYKRVLDELIRFQVVAGRDLDYSYCYPKQEFDGLSMRWDLSYFKYYFLKLSGVPFDEQRLDEDFTAFIDFLTGADPGYFMYRDFQTRNILLVDDKPYFIDYQGGRRGPLQYDLASLLFQARAGLTADFRDKMLDHYLTRLDRYVQVDRSEFIRYYYGFVLMRLLQVLGAYGFRGLFEGKAHFLQSTPHAIANLRWFLDNVTLPASIPELEKALHALAVSRVFNAPTPEPKTLTVTIYSFSYKNGIPRDMTGNGGGFVFDCRAIPNPGREETCRYYTGKDHPVRLFMEEREETGRFLGLAFQLVDQQISDYLDRSFQYLMVCFGCTGGQHRSVYCAEKLADHLRGRERLHVEVIHTEQPNWISDIRSNDPFKHSSPPPRGRAV